MQNVNINILWAENTSNCYSMLLNVVCCLSLVVTHLTHSILNHQTYWKKAKQSLSVLLQPARVSG